MPYETIVQNRKIRKQFLLTEEDNTKLQTVAELTGLSQNEIVNKALSAYLKRYKSKLNSVYGVMLTKEGDKT